MLNECYTSLCYIIYVLVYMIVSIWFIVLVHPVFLHPLIEFVFVNPLLHYVPSTYPPITSLPYVAAQPFSYVGITLQGWVALVYHTYDPASPSYSLPFVHYTSSAPLYQSCSAPLKPSLAPFI